MPAGDPQRTWFPEMLEILRARWRAGLPFAELIERSTPCCTRFGLSGTSVLPLSGARGADMLAKQPNPTSPSGP